MNPIRKNLLDGHGLLLDDFQIFFEDHGILGPFAFQDIDGIGNDAQRIAQIVREPGNEFLEIVRIRIFCEKSGCFSNPAATGEPNGPACCCNCTVENASAGKAPSSSDCISDKSDKT